jgi:uncharacterized protein with FMN-binding domain
MKKVALSLFVLAASGAYVLAQSGAEPSNDVLGSALPTDNAPTGSLPGRIADSANDGQPPAAKQPQPSVPLMPSRSRADDNPTPAALIAANKPDQEASAEPAQSPPLPVPPPKQPTIDPRPTEAVADPAPPPPTLAIVDVPLPRPRPAFRVTRASATRAVVTVAAGAGYTDGTYTGPTVDAYYGLVQVQAFVQGGRLVGIKVLRYPSDRRTSISINRQALPMLRDEVIRAQSTKVDIISGATLTSQAFIRSLDAALRQATA